LDYVLNYVCASEAPTPSEAVEAYLRDYIKYDQYACILRMHGFDPDTQEPFTKARSEKLNPKEAIQWVRRHGLDSDRESAALRALGFYDTDQREAFKELYDELPSIGDHLEWLRKNVFDDKYVEDFKLMEGFEERFWPKFGGQLRALGMTKENASLHYAAHWINPSFSQQFEMVQRLRPGRVDPRLVFSRDDLLR